MKNKRLWYVTIIIIAIIWAVVVRGVYLWVNSTTPTKTAEEFLQAIKDQDAETLSELYESDKIDIFEDTDENTDGLSDSIKEELIVKLLNFDYEITDEKVDGNKATVSVNISTYDFKNLFAEFIRDYISEGLSQALDGASKEELEKLAEEVFSKKLDKLTDKSVTTTVELKLVKKGNKWIVKNVDDSFINALTGGLSDTFSTENQKFI